MCISTATCTRPSTKACAAGVARDTCARRWSRTRCAVNTGDNTPAIIHLSLVPGDRLRLVVLPKGGGSENASALQMLKPSDGAEGVLNFVVERVSAQGVNACPPLVVGVGIGSNFEGCALLAKRALLRPSANRAPDPDDAQLEQELLQPHQRAGHRPRRLRRHGHRAGRARRNRPLPHRQPALRGEYPVQRPPAGGGGAVEVHLGSITRPPVSAG